ncbi:hypothetical protein CEP53_004934 [Fusarium sp. AF-6]|nr:hypothetical protein CEP53_004934 [Fusarium sp. AF-6]
MSDHNSTTSQRPRVLQGRTFPDNGSNKPELPGITISDAEESNRNADNKAHDCEASPTGSDLPDCAQPKDLVSLVLAAPTFYNIDQVHDRGNTLHMEWEQERLQKPNGQTASGYSISNHSHSSNEASSMVMSGPDEIQVGPASQALVNGGASKPADGVSIIRNKICSSLVKSAFDSRDYLPLDQLCEILSPSMVRQLLFKHFEEPKVSECERGILGTQGGDPPRRRRIFAILIMARQVNRLVKFIEHNVDDTALPLHFHQNQNSGQGSRVSYTLHRQDEIFQQGARTRQDENQQDEKMTKEFDIWPCDVAQDFMLWQPIIHIPFFKFPGDKIYFYDLRQDSILPFSHYDQQENGGYGSYPQSDCFAIKKPHIPCLPDYLQEIEPFDKLGVENDSPDLKHLIPLQLTFRHGRDYYLVFPWADGNLKKFWHQQKAHPENPDEVRWFMDQCSGITRGLRKLHHLSTQLSQNVVSVKAVNATNGKEMILGGKEWGRHGDIKPENILWFKNYDGEKDVLVISDFGLTQFNSAHSRSKVHQDQILGFSGTYRPPDLQLEGQEISQNYDVWSLGCVFLEFLSWFLLGYDAVVTTFVQARVDDSLQGNVKEDTFFTFEKDENHPQRISKKATLKKSVIKWIEKLHNDPRCTELFHALLDLIQFTMLVPSPDRRWKCNAVDTELRQLKSKCEKNDDYATRPTPLGPDPERFPKVPHKDETADPSPEPSSKELPGIEEVMRGTPDPSSTWGATTDQKPISAGPRDPVQRGFDNEVQDNNLTSGPDGTFEIQASAKTVNNSQRTDTSPSMPDPTKNSTELQVPSSGAQLGHISRTLGRNDAAQDSSDNLTNGYGPSEKTFDNAETRTQSTVDEAEPGDLPGDDAVKEAITSVARTQHAVEELLEPQPGNREPSNHIPSPEVVLGRSSLMVPPSVAKCQGEPPELVQDGGLSPKADLIEHLD